MARKRSTTKRDETPEPEATEEEETPELVPVVGRTEAAQAEWEQEQADLAEAERQRLAQEAVEGGAGPGVTGEHG